jgi:alkylation response protein AidB-like acyl-CoA dehydrogenase
MLDFELPSELLLLQETARSFASEQLRPYERVAEAARGPSDAVRARYDEIGLAALELPETLGGAGLGALATALVREELGAGDVGSALALEPLGAALYGLRELGGEPALERFAAPLLGVAGARALLVFDGAPRIHTEGGRAVGTLPWVPADRVDLLVVLERERAYVLKDGLRCEPVRGAGLRAAGAASLRIEAAAVLAEWVSTPGARRALAGARHGAAALLVGVMRQAADYARHYACERVAFGRPIAHHQALAFLIADMAAAVDAARLLVWDAAQRLDLGAPAEEACAAAFFECAEASMFVTPNALQILGGHGFMQDHPVEKYLRDARALGLLLGGIDAARDDAGRDLLGLRAGVSLGADDPIAAASASEA